jgi:hypothetical protein
LSALEMAAPMPRVPPVTNAMRAMSVLPVDRGLCFKQAQHEVKPGMLRQPLREVKH